MTHHVPEVIHSGPVFQLKRGIHDWKEKWLCLDDSGKLYLKHKDAYQIRRIVEFPKIITHVQVVVPDIRLRKKVESVPDDKHQGILKHPFFIYLPFKLDQKQITDAGQAQSYQNSERSTDFPSQHNLTLKLFAIARPHDFLVWLIAFASIVYSGSLFESILQKHRAKAAQNKEVTEDAIESHLNYEEALVYYKELWDDFVHQYREKCANQPNTQHIESETNSEKSLVMDDHASSDEEHTQDTKL